MKHAKVTRILGDAGEGDPGWLVAAKAVIGVETSCGDIPLMGHPDILMDIIVQ